MKLHSQVRTGEKRLCRLTCFKSALSVARQQDVVCSQTWMVVRKRQRSAARRNLNVIGMSSNGEYGQLLASGCIKVQANHWSVTSA